MQTLTQNKTDRPRRITVAAALVFLYLGTIFFRPLFRPDEFRYIEIAREMLSGSNWLVPKLNGLCYFEKPVLGHWCNAAMLAVIGGIPAAVRLAPAVFTLFGLGFLYFFLKKAGEPRLAVTATVMTALSALVFGVGTYGVLDGIFAPFVFVSCGCFFWAWQATERRTKVLWLFLAGLVAGLGFHVKGLLALLLPALAAVLFLILQKDYKKIFLYPWLPLLGALMTALPLVWLVHRADGDFWRQFLWVEHFQRMFTGAGANDDRSQPCFYYLPILVGGLMPWLLFLPTALRGWRAGGLWAKPVIRFAAAAAGSWFIFFSLSRAKLGTYILPAMPFCFILLAAGLNRDAEKNDFRLVNAILKGIALAAALAAVLLFLDQVCLLLKWIPGRFTLYRHGGLWLLPFAALSFGLGYFSFAAAQTAPPLRKFGLFSVGLWMVLWAVPVSVPQRFTANAAPEQFIRMAQREVPPNCVIAADRGLAAAACWSLKRNDLYVYGRPGELKYGLDREPSRQFSKNNIEQMLSAGKPVAVITNSAKVIKALQNFPHRKIQRGKNAIIICTGRSRSTKDNGK